MQQSLLREMSLSASGADLADVQVVAVAFGAQANPVKEALFEIVAPGEGAQVPFDVIAECDVGIAVLGGRLGVGRYLPPGHGDLSQEVETSLILRDRTGTLGCVFGCPCPESLHRSVGCCAKLAATRCHAPLRCRSTHCHDTT